MKVFAPEERQRLDQLYSLLDFIYRGLRELAAMQRICLRSGSEEGAGICDLQLQILSISAGRAWSAIQQILHAEPPKPPAPAPQTEILQ